MDLSVDNVIQLYTPLAGLAMLAFWSGVLTQKIAGIVERAKESEAQAAKLSAAENARVNARIAKIEDHAANDTALAIQVGVLASEMKGMAGNFGKLERDVSGIQRTLANMTSGKRTPVTEFKQYEE